MVLLVPLYAATQDPVGEGAIPRDTVEKVAQGIPMALTAFW